MNVHNNLVNIIIDSEITNWAKTTMRVKTDLMIINIFPN